MFVPVIPELPFSMFPKGSNIASNCEAYEAEVSIYFWYCAICFHIPSYLPNTYFVSYTYQIIVFHFQYCMEEITLDIKHLVDFLLDDFVQF